MKRCTTCGRQWDTADTRCPHDGTPLGPGATKSTGERAPSATWSAQLPALAEPRPAPNDELPPGSCVGEYVIERKIGAGGMGLVYGARHPVIGKRAAIKILNAKQSGDEEALSRFVLEAQAVNKIGHANIVDIFSFGTLDDGRSYFAMEWLQGETLGQRLRRGPLSAREAIILLSALCRALEAAHAAGVIHRDIKPDNVFLATGDDGWQVKLLDFGIAKLSTVTASISRTATGIAMGTPLYMAPEQAQGEPVDGRTDVYALGLLAYTAVCGVSLFQDEGSAIEVMAAHISKPPTSPRVHVPDIPRAFEKLILEMIAKNPADRPPLVEIRQRLAAIAAALEHTAPSPPPGPVTVRVSSDLLQRSQPPSMPLDMPEMPPDVPKLSSGLPKPSPETLKLSSGMPVAGEPIVGEQSESDDLIAMPRRSRWPLAVAAVAMLAAGVVLVIAVRRQGVPSPTALPAPPEPRLAVTPSPAPAMATPVAVAAPSPAPAAAAVDVKLPAQVTAEFVVEPGHARLAVDGHPLPLAGGRATLALSPGDHVAVATVGARSTRKQFVVTADHPASVSLRVPVADPHVVPPNTLPTSDDVDSVQNPFHR